MRQTLKRIDIEYANGHGGNAVVVVEYVRIPQSATQSSCYLYLNNLATSSNLRVRPRRYISHFYNISTHGLAFQVCYLNHEKVCFWIDIQLLMNLEQVAKNHGKTCFDVKPLCE